MLGQVMTERSGLRRVILISALLKRRIHEILIIERLHLHAAFSSYLKINKLVNFKKFKFLFT